MLGSGDAGCGGGRGWWSDELRGAKGFISCEVQLSLSTEVALLWEGRVEISGLSFPTGAGEVVVVRCLAEFVPEKSCLCGLS